jgi:hypothetical protein
VDQETVHKIAEEVARLSGYPWNFLAVQVIVTLLALGFVAFVGEYSKTRGKNLATTADFERLQKELSANTQLVETIKADVGQRDWAAREWTNLRRVKLEELLNKVGDCDAFCERQYHHILDTGSIPTERDFGSELDMITTSISLNSEVRFRPILSNFTSSNLRTLNLVVISHRPEVTKLPGGRRCKCMRQIIKRDTH